MLLPLSLFLITTTYAIYDLDYYILFNGVQNKSTLEFNTNVTNNDNNFNAYDTMKLAVDIRGNEYQFTAKYYQYLGYFVSCISSVCMNEEFYWSFWMNGEYSCTGLTHTTLSSNYSTNNIQMIYSNPNITCPSHFDDKNKHFGVSVVNISYTIEFGENLRRSTTVGSQNYTMKGIDVMERAVDNEGNGFSFTTIYYQTLGDFIDCIDGICSNYDTNQYWFLYLNGNQSMIGITFLTLSNGDKLTLSYQKYDPHKHQF